MLGRPDPQEGVTLGRRWGVGGVGRGLGMGTKVREGPGHQNRLKSSRPDPCEAETGLGVRFGARCDVTSPARWHLEACT